jgi:hypothetical protein
MVKNIEGTEDWVEVYSDTKSANWEWDGLSVYWSPSARRYFWFRDSGCSCNWHMDRARSVGDFYDGSRTELLADVGDWDSHVGNAIRSFSTKGS